ncbi:MAG: FecR domain-containing protein [Chitinophagaceae bacterium]
MENNIEEIGKLFFKHIRKELTANETATLESWLNESGRNRQFFEQTVNSTQLMEDIKDWQQAMKEMDVKGAWDKLVLKNPEIEKPKIIRMQSQWWKYVAAAVVLIIATTGYFWLYKSKPVRDKQEEITAKVENDIVPGQYKAKLTLSDGSTVILDSAANGKLAQQGNTIVLNKDGKIIYDAKNSPSSGGDQGGILYNTLTTAKGETYRMTLSDGSKIWLNSESSISYPVTFTGEERKIIITGEAYFEVATAYRQATKGSKPVKQPFKVEVGGMTVEVLGTHFNINAYANEETVKTTLLEGKVKVVAGKYESVLAPGQQVQLRKGSQMLQVMDNADVDQAIAWKNGFFAFNNDDLQTVMRQLARWYDVEVVYQGIVSGDTYGGKIRRNSKASEVLTILERNRVHFKIQGKKIIVRP